MNHLLATHHFADCAICAYHECGQILFAYLCGYRCTEVQLIDEGNQNGFTSYAVIDYGRDARYASKFMAGGEAAAYFHKLPPGERLEALEAGRRMARLFLGGSVAAAVFANGGNVRIPLPMQMDYMDLVHVEFIHYVIRELSLDQEEGFIEHGLQEGLYTLANGRLWDAVADLAGTLLRSGRMEKNDIEELLQQHGIVTGAEQGP